MQVWVSQILGDDHFKRMPRVTISVARWRTLTAQIPWMPSICQKLKPLTGYGDVSIWVNILEWDIKLQKKKNKKKKKIQTCLLIETVSQVSDMTYGLSGTWAHEDYFDAIHIVLCKIYIPVSYFDK